MTPLTLTTDSQEVPENFPGLLDLLASRPQPAVVWYGAAPDENGSPERVELSGRVLQNWAVKLVSLFREELEDSFAIPHPVVALDAAPHWKAAAVCLAGAALGARVHVLGQSTDETGRTIQADKAVEPDGVSASAAVTRAAIAALEEAPTVMVTDRPGAWTEGILADALGNAELAAISPGLLDSSFEEGTGEPVPAWVLDVSAEVRHHPDQLLEPLGTVPLPGHRDPDPAPGALVVPSASQLPPLQAWRQLSWAGDVTRQILNVWAHSGTVVLFDAEPDAAPASWTALLRNEGAH